MNKLKGNCFTFANLVFRVLVTNHLTIRIDLSCLFSRALRNAVVLVPTALFYFPVPLCPDFVVSLYPSNLSDKATSNNVHGRGDTRKNESTMGTATTFVQAPFSHFPARRRWIFCSNPLKASRFFFRKPRFTSKSTETRILVAGICFN